jgi:hypothetical protein
MSVLTDAIVLSGNNGLSPQEALSSMTPADKGNSGTGAGLVTTGTGIIDCKAELGFIPRMAYIQTDGNFGFKTLDGNTHLMAESAKTWIGPIWMPYIYEASHATWATTSTIHVF